MYTMKLLRRGTVLALAAAALALGADAPTPGKPKLRSGPEVGGKIPNFQATDHTGKPQTFETLRGSKGLLLLFTRSADWCPYCKGNIVQLERQRKHFESQGIRMAALTPDSVEILRNFAGRSDIHYPLLSDPDSAIIRAFDVLNDTIPVTHQFYGIPNPVEFLIDAKGVVTAKYFEEKYADRFTAGAILVRSLGVDSGAPKTEKATSHLTLRTWASDEIVRGNNRATLVMEVDLKPKMHVYTPEVKGYIPVEWTMQQPKGVTVFAPEFPASKLLHLPAIDEIVPVYEGKVRILRDVLLGKPDEIAPLLNADGKLVLSGTFRYQACDDKVCYIPESVPVEWTFQWEAHDRTRVPEELQKKPKGK